MFFYTLQDKFESEEFIFKCLRRDEESKKLLKNLITFLGNMDYAKTKISEFNNLCEKIENPSNTLNAEIEKILNQGEIHIKKDYTFW